jgi:hypothetical protein
MNLLKFFKKDTQNKNCASCKHYRIDNFGRNFSKCKHPKARYTYTSVERDTNWLDARLLGTCDRSGRRYEPNYEGLAKILRDK